MNGLDSKLKDIKMLISDVDGVMTDARIWLNSKGEWNRSFSVRDGIGIKLLLKSNIQVAIISGGKSKDVETRMQFLGISHVYLGIEDKATKFKEIIAKAGLQPHECAYIGDDIFDIPVLQEVGLGVVVPDAVEEVLEKDFYITKQAGGFGAVREVCDLILKHSMHVKGRA